MATKHLTPRLRRSRNPATTPSAPENPTPLPSAATLQALHEAIERERSRLMTAEAVLHCVAVAMDDDDRDDANRPHYPTLIELSREIVKQSIDQLDSARLKAAAERLGGHGAYEVKEDSVEYAVH